MKMYTSSVQTTKLIELGFEKPKNMIEGKLYSDTHFAYSIGELIEMLPENVAKHDEMPSTLNISLMNSEWCVQYADFLGTDFEFCNTELIDAIYDMIIKLKARGVI